MVQEQYRILHVMADYLVHLNIRFIQLVSHAAVVAHEVGVADYQW